MRQALFGPSVVFVLGGPGAGKGTQCTKIAETFGYLHLSAGDLLREERNRAGSEYGELINNYIKEGKLVPVEITIKLLRQAMMKYGWEGGRYLIDGFPRSFDNLEGWESVIGNTVRVKFVLFFDVSEETMQARLVERGKTSGRADDNLESIKKRFVTFQRESMPVVEKFHLQGMVRRMDAEQSAEQVWKDVQRNFGPSVIFVLGGPGAGKGTQCARIAANFGFQHLSAGDLLREERKRPGSELGELIESHIKEGKLVPVSIVVRLLQKAMEERGWEDGKYLIDGFPRSFENLQGWNEALGDKVDVKCCLFFDCSEEVMEARLLERGKTSGRADDNLESIKKRFATFKQESLPVVEQFSSEGLMRRINAEQSLDEVWSCVQEVMHNERDGHLLNQAVVLIKPSSFNKETQRFVQSFFTTNKAAGGGSLEGVLRFRLGDGAEPPTLTPALRRGVLLALAGPRLGRTERPAAAEPTTAGAAAAASAAPFAALAAARTARAWRSCARRAGRRLYRGEDIDTVALLRPKPDLLNPETYGQEGVRYFANLEQRLSRRPGAPLPSRGHLCGSWGQARQWGAACSVWPLGELRYAWPAVRATFFPAAEEVRVNEGLEEAVRLGHEVLFQSEGYVAVPEAQEPEFLAALRSHWRDAS
ncbi:unnamed protein product [Effrenium voratum]|nr:unnamed protein product [Effrenium voratum]